jgi:hypothetical protein
LSTPVTDRSCHHALIALTVSLGQLLSSRLSGHPPPRSSRLDCPYDSGQLIGDRYGDDVECPPAHERVDPVP